MTWWQWVLIVVGWLFCAAVAYCLGRASFRRDGLCWTTDDRQIMLMFVILFGPQAFVTMVAMTIGDYFGSRRKRRKRHHTPAKW